MKKWFKYKYLQLIRTKGGASIAALGFSIGFAVEMFTLPTAGLAFFLIFPLVYFFRASFAGALVGFAFGKTIYIPLAFLNNKVGGLLVSNQFKENIQHLVHFLPMWLEKAFIVNLNLIIGGMVNGTILGILLYYPVRIMLEMYTHKRKEKRRLRKKEMVI